MNMKAAEPRKRAVEPIFFLPIPLAASPLVFAAPPLKLPQNRQLRRLIVCLEYKIRWSRVRGDVSLCHLFAELSYLSLSWVFLKESKTKRFSSN